MSDKITSLSERERHVFDQLAAGKRITDIARDMGLSIKTVSTYRTRLLTKLEITSNAEIGALSARMGQIGGAA